MGRVCTYRLAVVDIKEPEQRAAPIDSQSTTHTSRAQSAPQLHQPLPNPTPDPTSLHRNCTSRPARRLSCISGDSGLPGSTLR